MQEKYSTNMATSLENDLTFLETHCRPPLHQIQCWKSREIAATSFQYCMSGGG